MRILTVANVPPDPNSGAAGTILQTNIALRELGHDVDEIWADDLGPRRIAHGNLHSLLEQPRRYTSAIRNAFDEGCYDAVLSQQPQSWMAARDHRRQRRAGVFLTVSQGVESRIWPILQNYRKVLRTPSARFPHRLFTPAMQNLLSRQWRLAASYSDGIVVQHSQDKRFICDSYSLPENRAHIWPSGLSDALVSRPLAPMTSDRKGKLLFVGQCAFYKGVHFLGRIVTTVLRQFPNASMSWVCDAADHACALRRFESDVRDRVQLIDWGPQEKLIDILDGHGIFIFPTLAEGFAKAPLEAMARGMYVVASNCCGMQDYVTDGTGFLCRVGNVSEFVMTVASILRSGATLPGAAQVAAHATTYTWHESAANLVHFISSRTSERPTTTHCSIG